MKKMLLFFMMFFSTLFIHAMDERDQMRKNHKMIKQATQDFCLISTIIDRVQQGTVSPNCFSRAFVTYPNGIQSIIYPLIYTIEYGLHDILAKMLQLNADPNGFNPSNRLLERLIESAVRLKTIQLLLHHKADPTLCHNSTLISPLLYYVHRKYISLYKKDRCADKALRCIKLLLKAKANVNYQRDGLVPLEVVLHLHDKEYLSEAKAKEMVILLTAYGADPAYINSEVNQTDVITIMQQERKKYQALRTLLIGHKDMDSPLHQLPKDVLIEIGKFVRDGEFKEVQQRQMTDEDLEKFLLQSSQEVKDFFDKKRLEDSQKAAAQLPSPMVPVISNVRTIPFNPTDNSTIAQLRTVQKALLWQCSKLGLYIAAAGLGFQLLKKQASNTN